jgi:hypothetical protein
MMCDSSFNPDGSIRIQQYILEVDGRFLEHLYNIERKICREISGKFLK